MKLSVKLSSRLDVVLVSRRRHRDALLVCSVWMQVRTIDGVFATTRRTVECAEVDCFVSNTVGSRRSWCHHFDFATRFLEPFNCVINERFNYDRHIVWFLYKWKCNAIWNIFSIWIIRKIQFTGRVILRAQFRPIRFSSQLFFNLLKLMTRATNKIQSGPHPQIKPSSH